MQNRSKFRRRLTLKVRCMVLLRTIFLAILVLTLLVLVFDLVDSNFSPFKTRSCPSLAVTFIVVDFLNGFLDAGTTASFLVSSLMALDCLLVLASESISVPLRIVFASYYSKINIHIKKFSKWRIKFIFNIL